MAKGTFLGDDIDIYLTDEDITTLGYLEIRDEPVDGSKVTHKDLEIELLSHDDSRLKAIVHHVIKDDTISKLGDGIDVRRTDYGFYIRINSKAYERLDTSPIQGYPLTGTRYDSMNKINFWMEE